jgi:hypothetical protein
VATHGWRRRARAALAAGGLAAATLVTAACWPSGSVEYQPPFTPIVLVLNSDGSFELQGRAQIATALGTFSVNVDALRSTPEPQDGILLYIDHVVKGRYVEDRFRLDTDGPLVVEQKGRTTTTFTSDFIRIVADDAVTTITVRDGRDVAAGPPPNRKAFAGTWRGPVDQPGSQPYSMVMKLRLRNGKLSGSVDYPELGCGGTLTEGSAVPGGIMLNERLTYGVDTCVPEGRWSMVPVPGGRLAASYSGVGVADATLERR